MVYPAATERNYDKTIRVSEDGLPNTATPADKKCLDDGDARVAKILIGSEDVQKRVKGLGRNIAEAYAGVDEILMVIILKGAFVFAADLGRAVYEADGPSVKYDFIKASAYGDDIKGGGETARIVEITHEPEFIEGRDVLLVEDIVDQGFTLARVKKYLEAAGARSVKICVLCDKVLEDPSPEVSKIRDNLTLDFTGFEAPDLWLAGYGVDAGEDFRFLPCVIAVDEDYYRWRP